MVERFMEFLMIFISVGLATCQLSVLNPSSRLPVPPNPPNPPSPQGPRSPGGTTSHRTLHALQQTQEENAVRRPNIKKGNISCYSCKLDFRKKDYYMNHPCLGRHNGRNVSSEFLVECGYHDTYCRAERMEVNGILVWLTRECSNQCYYGCRPRGFGINYETCAECCDADACNHMYPESHASNKVAWVSLVAWALVLVWASMYPSTSITYLLSY